MIAYEIQLQYVTWQHDVIFRNVLYETSPVETVTIRNNDKSSHIITKRYVDLHTAITFPNSFRTHGNNPMVQARSKGS